MRAEQLTMFDAPRDTLADARKELRDKMMDGEPLSCPCCDGRVQVYRRHIHTSMVLQLIRHYRLGGADDFVHVKEQTGLHVAATGDFTKFKYWGLIEQKPKDAEDTKKKTSGMWRITDKGVAFIHRDIKLPHVAVIYRDEVLGFSEEQITIDQALGDDFDYSKLMSGEV